MRWMAQPNQRILEIPRVRRLRRMAINENMREYNEYMLHEYPQGRIVEKQRGNNMLGRAYLYISERANSKYRRYAQRPHKKSLKKQTYRLFKDVAKGIRTAPSRLLRNAGAVIGKGINAIRKVTSRLRRQGVNDKQMRMASVLKGRQYRKKSK